MEKCKCEIKKNIKNNYKKMERKKIMTWTLTWLNVSAAILNTTFQLLVIYRLLIHPKKKTAFFMDVAAVFVISKMAHLS